MAGAGGNLVNEDQFKGDKIDNAPTVNLAKPVGTREINGMIVDLTLLAEAADRIGADKYTMLTISGYRNARGELVPDYDSVKIIESEGET